MAITIKRVLLFFLVLTVILSLISLGISFFEKRQDTVSTDMKKIAELLMERNLLQKENNVKLLDLVGEQEKKIQHLEEDIKWLIKTQEKIVGTQGFHEKRIRKVEDSR